MSQCGVHKQNQSGHTIAPGEPDKAENMKLQFIVWTRDESQQTYDTLSLITLSARLGMTHEHTRWQVLNDGYLRIAHVAQWSPRCMCVDNKWCQTSSESNRHVPAVPQGSLANDSHLKSRAKPYGEKYWCIYPWRDIKNELFESIGIFQR